MVDVVFLSLDGFLFFFITAGPRVTVVAAVAAGFQTPLNFRCLGKSRKKEKKTEESSFPDKNIKKTKTIERARLSEK
jgi:hypothetical protein